MMDDTCISPSTGVQNGQSYVTWSLFSCGSGICTWSNLQPQIEFPNSDYLKEDEKKPSKLVKFLLL